MEGMLRLLIHSSRIVVENPKGYEARNNIMWITTWVINTLVVKGKATEWMIHMIGQIVGAYTDVAHGMILFRCFHGISVLINWKFRRYAVNVWDVDADGKNR